MLTCTGQTRDEICFVSLKHRAAAGLQLSLLCSGDWIYDWKDSWALRLYLQRMLLASRTRKSSQDIWPVRMEGISSSLHTGKAHTHCALCENSTTKSQYSYMDVSPIQTVCEPLPTLCPGPDPFRKEGGLKRKPLIVRCTLSRKKMWQIF